MFRATNLLFIAIRVLDIEVCTFISGCDGFEFSYWVLIEIYCGFSVLGDFLRGFSVFFIDLLMHNYGDMMINFESGEYMRKMIFQSVTQVAWQEKSEYSK